MNQSFLSIVFCIVCCAPASARQEEEYPLSEEKPATSWSATEVVMNVMGTMVVVTLTGLCVGIAWRLNDAR